MIASSFTQEGGTLVNEKALSNRLFSHGQNHSFFRGENSRDLVTRPSVARPFVLRRVL